jgi:hypothetical protein
VAFRGPFSHRGGFGPAVPAQSAREAKGKATTGPRWMNDLQAASAAVNNETPLPLFSNPTGLKTVHIFLPKSIDPKSLIFVAAAAPTAMIVYGRLRIATLTERSRTALIFAAAALAIFFGLVQVALVGTNLLSPREWDFKQFWTYGVAAANGSNPYDHANLLRIAESINASDELRSEMYCFYPPPSLLMFGPLGLLPLQAAMAVWYSVLLGILLLDVWLLTRFVTQREGRVELLFVVAVVLMYRGVTATVAMSQTNFLILFVLLLFWRDRDRARGGFWLGLGMMVKPVIAIAGLYLLVRQKWSAIVAFVVTVAVTCAITAAIFGPRIFTQYLNAGELAKAYPYAQLNNQSLLGVLLRNGPELSPNQLPVLSPWFLGIAAAMTAWTIVCLIRFRKHADDWGLAMTFVLGFVLYPPTLSHYSVVLLLPVMLWWRDLGERRDLAIMTSLLIGAVYALDGFKMSFAAMLLAWTVLSVFGMHWMAHSPGNERVGSQSV